MLQVVLYQAHNQNLRVQNKKKNKFINLILQLNHSTHTNLWAKPVQVPMFQATGSKIIKVKLSPIDLQVSHKIINENAHFYKIWFQLIHINIDIVGLIIFYL